MKQLGSEQAWIHADCGVKNRDKSARNVVVCFYLKQNVSGLLVLAVSLWGFFYQLCLFKQAALFLLGR